MRIAIMGSGGIGGYYGARLAQAGEDVTFIARGAHLAALRSRGLRVQSQKGDIALPRVTATDNPAQVGAVELVLLATKTYDLDAAAQALRPLLGPQTAVLPLLNGVDIAERVEAVVGPGHVLGGICVISCALAEPGVIHHLSPFDAIQFGELDGQASARAQAIEAAFKRTPVTIERVANVRVAIWQKYIALASFAGVACVARQAIGALRSDPDLRALLRGSIEEIAALGRSRGVALPADTVDAALAKFDTFPAAMKPSMLLDLERGNRLELDALTGTAVRMGQAAQVPLPISGFLYAALKPHLNGRAG